MEEDGPVSLAAACGMVDLADEGELEEDAGLEMAAGLAGQVGEAPPGRAGRPGEGVPSPRPVDNRAQLRDHLEVPHPEAAVCAAHKALDIALEDQHTARVPCPAVYTDCCGGPSHILPSQSARVRGKICCSRHTPAD